MDVLLYDKTIHKIQSKNALLVDVLKSYVEMTACTKAALLSNISWNHSLLEL